MSSVRQGQEPDVEAIGERLPILEPTPLRKRSSRGSRSLLERGHVVLSEIGN